MATLVLDTILAPIAGADPCGSDLEYDVAFGELERLGQGKPEQQIGSTIVPAEEPDWKSVQRQALELLGRSKDLRVAAHLTKALLRTSGWNGFSQGLSVLRDFVDHQWPGIYPRLDPDDDNDPTMRVNILNSMADGETISGVRATVLVASRTLGRFTLKDLEIASGDALAAGTQGPTMASLDAAALDCDLGELQALAVAARAAGDALVALEASVAAQVGESSGVNYSKLLPLVRKASQFLGAKLALRAPAAAGAAMVDGVDAGNEGGGPVANRGGGLPGEIGSREDVIRALDKISAYYDRYEPSSPVPLFMARCKKLVMMSFIDIVRELVPEAVSQVEVLKGRTE
ncbi:MAG TPA: type VI secretion system protein TssA [Polyangia bacterium]|jgi:type VI secretion system protein ImpA|nr:type VI secretion system protein TssA [Polyangia bacterium]